MHDPYSVTPRKPLTNKQRLALFVERKGVCCICGLPIDGVKEMWDEHLIPLADGGDNSTENRDVAHRKCAQAKTSTEATGRAKLRRAAARHLGASRPKGRPMPGSRRSGLKKRFDGTVERR